MDDIRRDIIYRICDHLMQNLEEDDKTTPLSEKAQIIKDTILNGDYGCRTESVLKLVSTIIDEDITMDDDNSSFGKCIILLDSDNCQDRVNVGSCYIHLGHKHEFRHPLNKNSVKSSWNPKCRLATREEYTDAIKNCSDSFLNAFISILEGNIFKH